MSEKIENHVKPDVKSVIKKISAKCKHMKRYSGSGNCSGMGGYTYPELDAMILAITVKYNLKPDELYRIMDICADLANLPKEARDYLNKLKQDYENSQ